MMEIKQWVEVHGKGIPHGRPFFCPLRPASTRGRGFAV